MSAYCPGCGRTDMAGITHVCPPLPQPHSCQPPTLPAGLTDPQQPDWTCGVCGKVWRDWNGGGSSPVRWWAEIRGAGEPRK